MVVSWSRRIFTPQLRQNAESAVSATPQDWHGADEKLVIVPRAKTASRCRPKEREHATGGRNHPSGNTLSRTRTAPVHFSRTARRPRPGVIPDSVTVRSANEGYAQRSLLVLSVSIGFMSADANCI